jgi:hypothetical protein
MAEIEKDYLLWNIFRLIFSIWLWMSPVITHILVILGVGDAQYDTDFVRREERQLIMQLALNLPLQILIICLSYNFISSNLDKIFAFFRSHYALHKICQFFVFIYIFYVLYFLFFSHLNMQIAFYDFLEVNSYSSHFRLETLWFSNDIFINFIIKSLIYVGYFAFMAGPSILFFAILLKAPRDVIFIKK